MRSLLVALWIVGLAALEARAADSVKVGKKSYSGEIKEISPTEITIELSKGGSQKCPVNEIVSVRFDKEPGPFKSCRDALDAGRLEDADKALVRIKVDELTRPELKQDYDYFRATATARLALAGNGDLAEANLKINEFIRENATSFHLIEALMTQGEIQVSLNQTAEAAETYSRVEATAPWPDFKVRALVAKGRAKLSQSSGEEALALFDDALKLAGEASGELVEQQKLLATVNRAQALALLNRADEGIAIVEGLIVGASADQQELHARAYTALGNCHLKAGRKKEARDAFLHVHLLYPVYADLHAEALAHLVGLWKDLDRADRSQECAELLKSRYAKSKWAKAAS